MVIIVFGLPGSGKSFFAEKLAEKTGAAYLNSDRLRNEIISGKTYNRKEKRLVYQEMLTRVKTLVREQKNIVVDATFYKEDTRKIFLNDPLLSDALHFIEITADKKIIAQRLQKPRPHSDANFHVYQKIKRQWEPFTLPHLVLHSTNDNIEYMLKEAIACLAEHS